MAVWISICLSVRQSVQELPGNVLANNSAKSRVSVYMHSSVWSEKHMMKNVTNNLSNVLTYLGKEYNPYYFLLEISLR